MGTSMNTVQPGNISPVNLPSKFNKCFTEKIETIRSNLDSTPHHADSVVFSGIPLETFHAISSEHVKQIILKMPKKSCDPDPIPSPLFLDCLYELIPVITDIINTSLISGVVPQCFKHALIKPLKKSNLDPELLKNYHPVSNLLFLSKVLERVVLTQLMTHLETHNLLEMFQSAYRKCHSTETALLHVVNDLLQASDDGHVSILSLLNLSAAFDTTDHVILSQWLSSTFGCTGTILGWFESYLSNRTQSDFVNDVQSAPSTLKYGVPQGLVLGPILFTMYTQPLGSVIQQLGTTYHFFADDLQLHDSAAPSEFSSLVRDMTSSIEEVGIWIKGNKLKMNDDKTELTATGSKSKLKQVSTNSMVFQDCETEFSKSVRNLGVFLDESLSMEVQVNQLFYISSFVESVRSILSWLLMPQIHWL